jgi:hypothetical protein
MFFSIPNGYIQHSLAPLELVELAPGREIEGEEMGKFEENLEGKLGKHLLHHV